MLQRLLLPILMIPALVISQPQDTVWTWTHGGQHFESCFDLARGPDKDIWMVGQWFDEPNQLMDWFVVRLDSNHELEHEWQIESPSSSIASGVLALDSNRTVIYGSDSGFTIARIVAWDDIGNELWRRDISGDGDNIGLSRGILTSDTALLFCGTRPSDTIDRRPSIWLLKTSLLGEILWSHTYGRPDLDYGTDVIETSDGGYAVAGGLGSLSNGSIPYRGHILKTDPDGNLLWERVVGSDNDDDDWLASVAEIGDQYWFTGYTTTNDYRHGIGWLVRTTAAGQLIDSVVIPLEDHRTAISEFNRIVVTDSGTIVLVGETNIWNSNQVLGWIVGLDDSAQVLWSNHYGDFRRFYSAIPVAGGGLLIAGQTWASGSSDFLLVETQPRLLDVLSPRHTPDFLPCLQQNYPNPFNATTEIRYDLPQAGPVTVAVYDLAGRFVATLADGRQSAGSYRVNFDGTSLASGIYFCRLETPQALQTQKMLLVK